MSSNSIYTFKFSPQASTIDEFIDKFVKNNPYIKTDFVLSMLENVRSGKKINKARWNQYQKGTDCITVYTFVQNSIDIGREYFSGNYVKVLLKKFNLDDSYTTSINSKIRECLREPSKEEAILIRESSRSTNPAGFNATIYRDFNKIVNQFISGEPVNSIAKEYGCTDKVIKKVLMENCDYHSIQQQNTAARKQNIIDRKLKESIVRDEKKRIREENKKLKFLLNEQKKYENKLKVAQNPKRIKHKMEGNQVITNSIALNLNDVSFNSLYEILSKKEHNTHYLKRYIRFILSCLSNNSSKDLSGVYFEEHHIAPKSYDLFPEYFSFIDNPWNSVKLTGRQHFIAHWMLWKAYGGNQIYAFKAMCNGQKSKYQKGRYSRINSKTYECLKKENSEYMSSRMAGKAAYKDSNGNIIYCSTKDERVLSGELISLSTGRKFKRKKKSLKSSISIREAKWKTTPVRKKALYFLDIRIEVEYTQHNYKFLEYIEQGWSTTITPEYLSIKSAKVNIAVFENKITKQILENNYSKFEYLYDLEDSVVLMGVRKTLERQYPGRYIPYASSKNFKHYKDLLTGNMHQLDASIFPILDNFVEMPSPANKKRKITT